VDNPDQAAGFLAGCIFKDRLETVVAVIKIHTSPHTDRDLFITAPGLAFKVEIADLFAIDLYGFYTIILIDLYGLTGVIV